MSLVDILIICIFLCSTLYIGLKSGKKIKTFGDYAIGNRNFSNFAICCTVAATAIDGNAIIGGVGKIYEVGIIQLLAQIGLPISCIIAAKLLVHRFSLYYGCYSLGDIFYKAYGLTGKIVASIVGCIYETFIMGIQFIAMGTAINVLTGLSYNVSLLISAGIILIYTGRGGVRAVTFTDVLQFMVLALAIPILIIIIFSKIGGISGLINNVPHSYISFDTEQFNRYLFLMFPLMLPLLSPHHIQRFLMTNSAQQGQEACYSLSWLFLLVTIVTAFLGLSAKLLFPELAAGDQALFALIINYLPAGVLGIAIIGLLAVMMSSADSELNTGSVMLVNDIIIPYNKYIKKKDLTEAEKLKYARITSILMGLGAIIFASQRIGIFEARVLIRTIWISIILFPLYFLLFNMKISIKGLFVSAIVGSLSAVLWTTYLKPITNIDGLFPGFFANIITVLFFYILGGRQKVFSKEELECKFLAEKIKGKKRLTVRDLQTKNNIVLGLCLLFLQLIPLAFDLTTVTYSKLLLVLVNGTMAILLIFGSSLEVFSKEKRFQCLNLITLFFCLPITSAYLFLSSGGNLFHALTLLFSFIVMLSSIEKKHEILMVIACFLTASLSTFFYGVFDCHLFWPEIFAWQHSFYLFGFLSILFLIRSNLNTLHQIKEREKEHERYLMARSLSHDLTTPLVALRILIDQKKDSFAPEEYRLLKNINSEMGSYVEHFIVSNLKDGIRLKPENLNECLISCTEKQKILNRQRFDVQLQASGTVFARVDAVLFRRIINNLLKICTHALPQGCNTVIVSLEETPQGKAKVLLQAAQGHFSAKLIQSMFIEDQKLGDEIDLGISFREFQDIVTQWHGKLEMITHDDDAFFQMTIPCEKQ